MTTEAKVPETYLHELSPRIPASVVSVIERTESDVVFAPYHGGMSVRVGKEVFARNFSEVKIDDLYKYRKGRFSADGSHDFDGFTDGRVWNGWACPMATLEVAAKLLEACCDNETLVYSREGDVLCVTDSNYPDEPYRLEGREIEVDGQKHRVWDLSELGWCFVEE